MRITETLKKNSQPLNFGRDDDGDGDYNDDVNIVLWLRHIEMIRMTKTPKKNAQPLNSGVGPTTTSSADRGPLRVLRGGDEEETQIS